MNRIVIANLHVLICLFFIGCSSAGRNEFPEPNTSQIEIKKTTMVSFKMIKTAGNITLGYLEETENIIANQNSLSGDEMKSIFYVYDKDFNKVGFMTEHGTVSLYQYTPEGNVIPISTGAIYTIEAGNRRLLAYDGEIYYDEFEAAPIWRDSK